MGADPGEESRASSTARLKVEGLTSVLACQVAGPESIVRGRTHSRKEPASAHVVGFAYMAQSDVASSPGRGPATLPTGASIDNPVGDINIHISHSWRSD
jgi:hypothetical protein